MEIKEIKETEFRNLYKNEIGISYWEKPMKYIEWKRKKILELKKLNQIVRVMRDDPESYPDKSKRINYSRAIW
jgi:hypothetical protein